MPENNDTKILKQIKPSRVILPMIIGLGVVIYMISKDAKPETFSVLHFSAYVLLWLFISFLMMITRDVGYMVRLKILSGNELSWKSVFNIIMLWEFTSAVTPSAIGGTSVAVYFIHKEGISVGKSTAIVMATSILDELYFIIMFPLLLLVISPIDLFQIGNETSANIDFTNKCFYFAVIGYSIKFLFTAFVSYGLFVNPKIVKNIIVSVFKLKFLKKWSKAAENTGNDVIIASKELKSKPFSFWIKAFFATFFSWSARYWVINFLLLALLSGSTFNTHDYISGFYEHFLIFARQLVMWIMMLIMPTPGGSGFAEAVFSEYMAEFIPVGFVAIMSLMWRIITYYPYLLIGVFVLPKWVKKIMEKK